MNFLSNLFGRLFGRKEDQQPQASPAPVQTPVSSAPALAVQSTPSPTVSVQPAQDTRSINPVQLVKAQPNVAVTGPVPSSSQPEPGILEKVANYLVGQNRTVTHNANGGTEINYDQTPLQKVGSRVLDTLNGPSSPIGEQGYFNKQVIQPVEQGVGAVKSGTPLEKLMGAFGTIRGIFNATPLGIGVNSAISSTAGLAKAARGQDVNPLQEINKNTQLSEGFNVTNPYAATALDLGANTLAMNPTGVVAGVSELGNLKNATNIVDILKTLGSSGRNILGFNPETSGLVNGNKDLPPLQKAVQASEPIMNEPIATMVPKVENPTAGALNNPYGDTTIEDAIFKVPAIDRAQEAAQAEMALKKAAVPGARTVNDLKPVELSPQDMHSPNAIQEAANPQLFTRPEGTPLNAANVPFPDQAAVPRSMTDISAPTLQKAPAGPVTESVKPTSVMSVEAPVTPEPVAPPAITPEVAPVASNVPAVASTPGEPPIPATVPESAPLAPVSTEIPQKTPLEPQIPANSAAEVKAPRQADILLNKESAADRAEIMKKLPKSETMSLDTLQNRGAARVASMGDNAAVAASYANEPAINGVEDYYAALEAAKRLSGLTDEASTTARANIYSAMLDFASKSGLNLRSTQILFNDMPVEMKVSVTLKNMVKSLERQFGADSPEVTALSDPARRSEIETKLNDFFTKDQAIQDKMNVSRGILSDPQAYSKEQIDAAGAALNTAKDELSKNATEFAGFRDQIVPSNIGAQEKIGNFQRTSMLSSIAGGVRDLIQTPITAAREIINSKVEGAIGSTLNKVNGTPGEFIDSGLSGTDLVKAVPSALEKFGQNAAKGDTYASIEDVLSNIKRTPDRTDLTGQTKGLFSRLTKAKTNLANDAVEGIKTGETTRLLRQEGQQSGLTGEALDKYVQAGSYDPPANILRQGQHLQDVVNNINGNPITDALRGINTAIGKIPGVGKVVANALDPFPTWLGGNIWNSITDRNVIANASKFVYALAKGDDQQAVTQLSKAVTGVGELYATGWVLSQTGVITNKDANGDSYEGLYFHVGNRYIPVSMAGAFAPNIILGNIAYNAMHSEGDPVKAITDGLSNTVKSLNIGNITGQNGWLMKSIDQSTTDFTHALSTAAAGIAGQFIPAVGGDVNAVLNQTDLNPTHEAANTKVEDPNSASGHATNFPATALAQLENKIPGLSQTLPRQDGVAAQDFVDRVMQGNHESNGQVQAKADAQAQVDSAYNDLKDNGAFTPAMRDILDKETQKIYDQVTGGKTVPPKDLEKLVSGFTKGVTATGDTRFLEDGNYDANLAALKIKRAQQAADKTTTEKELKQYDVQIKRGEVYKKYEIPYSLVEKYQKTDLSEWRNLGDPKSDTYDPELYQKLWNLDNALATAGGSRNTDDEAKTFYSAKVKKAGSGSGSSASKGNKIGQIVDLGKVSLTKLAQGQSTNTPRLPTIPLIKAGELSKKRKITVS